ncbi:hypothetical protein K469DRAFT_715939 [Zopfia rhizophila CBS 207.26]|uniref:Uncharacterized protein n=1 Tax=Zopfia rhizophila CBS 207.26 TaxID=1314779 RepID=A0A6A6DL46_9PEZI|nr:hypothetical protein K469DRAFT_715939 [Zopfia rhizophila CBS 207.26]
MGFDTLRFPFHGMLHFGWVCLDIYSVGRQILLGDDFMRILVSRFRLDEAYGKDTVF